MGRYNLQYLFAPAYLGASFRATVRGSSVANIILIFAFYAAVGAILYGLANTMYLRFNVIKMPVAAL
jgi:hypothetical protein